jgi:nitric oxide reductase subunit B
MTAAPVPTQTDRRTLMVGKGWVQAVALVVIFGFFVMGILAYRTYTASMPQPDRVVTGSGEVLFTGEDITAGQEIFLARGLMQYGSIVGHGAYLGPDYTADYLRRATDFVETQLRNAGAQDPRQAVIEEFRTNRYDEATKTLTFTDNQAKAFEAVQEHYAQFFGEDSTRNGLVPNVITDPNEIRQLTAFFAWTAWAAAAERPGHSYSYTNNWPPEPRVNNVPTADVVVWSVLSLVALLGGIGALFAVYGRFSAKVGWQSAEAPAISFRQPGDIALTPAQKATAWFFFTIAALFLVQTLLGAAAEHYRADILSFFGIDLAKILPFNLARTWHLQLALFWTAASFLAAGIFLTPFIAGREPKKQSVLVYVLFGAVVLVVVGSLVSEALSIHGVSWAKGPLFSQQWEYLDLPRIWQALLSIGMFVWIVIIYRGIRSRLKASRRAICRGCSSSRRWLSRPSTPSDCWPATAPT